MAESLSEIPSTPWQPDVPLLPSPHEGSKRFWQPLLATGTGPGELAPAAGGGSWRIALDAAPLPAGMWRITPHGFQRAGDGAKPGYTWWMLDARQAAAHLPPEASPVLHAEGTTARIEGDTQYLPADGHVLCLVLRRSRRALELGLGIADSEEDARQLALRAVERDALALFDAFSALHGPFWRQQASLDPATQQSLYRAWMKLEGSLRAPCGVIPYVWALEPEDPDPGFPVRLLYPLVRAWIRVHPPTATALVKSVLACQRGDGGVPAVLRPDGLHEADPAPHPLLATCAALAYQADPNREFIDFAAPRLRHYFAWLSLWLDPQRNGWQAWPSAETSWLPETHDDRVLTADATALLAAEWDAYQRLEGSEDALDPQLEQSRQALTRRLADFFHCEKRNVVLDRFLEGDHVARLTFSALTPLLDQRQDAARIDDALRLMAPSGALHSQEGVLAWERWTDDTANPPVRLSDQALLLDVLEARGLTAPADALRSDLMNHPDLAADHQGSIEAEAFRMALLAPRHTPDDPATQLPRWLAMLNTHRTTTAVVLTVLLAALGLGIVLHFQTKKELTRSATGTMIGLAERYYQEGRCDEALALYQRIEQSTRNYPGIYFLMGKTFFRLGQLDEAATHFERARENPFQAVESTMNLALVRKMQDRTAESITLYREVTNRYATISPRAAATAAKAIALMGEKE